MCMYVYVRIEREQTRGEEKLGMFNRKYKQIF